MARPNILFVLAASIVALAALSEQAFRPPHRHRVAAPSPLTSRRHPHHAPPHKTKHARKQHTHLSPAPAPVNRMTTALPPEPYPDFYAFAGRCLRKLTAECGREIFRGIFGDKEVVSDNCCLELVAMGRRCHRGILKATIALPELPKREKKEIKRRDARIWNQCIFVSDALKNWNSSLLLSPQTSV